MVLKLSESNTLIDTHEMEWDFSLKSLFLLTKNKIK